MTLVMRKLSLVPTLGALALGVISATSVSAQVFWAGTSYSSFSDSLFSSSIPSTYFYLENFEDNTFTPGFTTTAGWYRVSGSQFIDSVDGDDGSINGNGNGGGSFYSGGLNRTLTIGFDAGVLGSLPTDAGFVWTDVGGVTTGTFGMGPLAVRFYDGSDNLLAAVSYNSIGDGLITGQTAEDRFFGFSWNVGISRIEVEMPTSGDWEIDHIQYGSSAVPSSAVPEPSTVGLGGAGVLLALALWRRSRRRA